MPNINFSQSLEHKLQDGVLKKSELRALENQARKTADDPTDDIAVDFLKSRFKDGAEFHLVDLKIGSLELKSKPVFTFVDDITAPTPDQIKAGKAVIGADPTVKQEGPAVKTAQHRLKAMGFAVEETGVMDNKTVAALKQFQAVTGCTGEHKDKAGQIGATTWKRLNQLSENQSVRQKMVDTANANSDRAFDSVNKVMLDHGTKDTAHAQGFCYTYVAAAADAASRGQHMLGVPAWGAAISLKDDPRYQEITVSKDQLKHLLPGTVVIWEQGSSENGHISIADGKGHEISDFIASQQNEHWGKGGYHVFLPVK